MKKIFIDAHVFDGEFQGSQTYLKELYLQLLKSSDEYNLVFGSQNINNVKRYFKEHSKVEYIKYKSNNSINRIFFEIPKIIDELKCDFAHFQYILPFRRSPSCKYINTLHDILFLDFKSDFSLMYRLKRKYLFFLSAKYSDILLTVSEYSKHRISHKFGIPLNEITVTPNGVSKDFSDFGYSKNYSKKLILNKFQIRDYILFVSRIEPRKNQLLLLDNYLRQELWKDNKNLVFIGKGSLAKEFLKRYLNLPVNIRQHIIWLEQVEYSLLLHFYNGADCFIYPSKAEGFGIPPLEAGALETPVLCSEETAMSDFDFFNPHVFNESDFSKKFELFLDSMEKINTCEVRNQILKKYSWENSVSVFKSVLN